MACIPKSIRRAALLALLSAAGCGKAPPAPVPADSPVAEAVRALREGDPAAREAAARTLAQTPHPDALAALADAAREGGFQF